MMAENIDIDTPKNDRQPGRPRAIQYTMEGVAVHLYRQGNGYRKISRILSEEYGISAHYTTVKRVLKRLGVLGTKPG